MLTLIPIGWHACFFVLLCMQSVTSESSVLCCSPSSRVVRDTSRSSQLRALDLSHNGLSYLYNRTFLGLNVGELVNLSLANNVIWCVGQHAFLGLAELERLDLSGNNLTFINPDTFSYNRKLYWLSLADNRLFTLPSQGVFIHVSALTFLDLSNCSVADIYQRIFEDINNVKYLNMSHNSIHNIQHGSFHLLKQLRCLDISFNNLSSLYVDVFIHNTHISDYLSSDSCETYVETEPSPSVVKLKADNNPWNCDCTMKVLFDYVSERNFVMEYDDDVSERNSSLLDLTCKEPSGLENSSWEALKDVDCSTSTAPAVRSMTVTEVTEESTVDIHMFTPTTPISSLEIWLICIIIILFIICACLTFYIRKYKRQHPNMNEDAGRRQTDSEEEDESML